MAWGGFSPGPLALANPIPFVRPPRELLAPCKQASLDTLPLSWVCWRAQGAPGEGPCVSFILAFPCLTERASGTFVGQREQISSSHQPGVRGYAPAKPHSCLQTRLQLGQRKPWALGTLHFDPQQAHSGLPLTRLLAVPLAQPPAPSADTWASPLAGRVAGTMDLRKIMGSWF